MAIFDYIPFCIVVLILQLMAHLDFKDVFSLQECCKVFYRASLDPLFHKTIPMVSLLVVQRWNQGYENFLSQFFRARNPGVMVKVAFKIFFDCGLLKSLHLGLTLLKHVPQLGILMPFMLTECWGPSIMGPYLQPQLGCYNHAFTLRMWA